MRVLVTGATGFVGSHVTEALVAAGHEVNVAVRATSDRRWLAHLPVRQCALDLGAPARLTDTLVGVDAIVHVAGITRAASDAEFVQVNVEATRALLSAAVTARVERFVLISSLAARGPDRPEPQLSPYGHSKREAEQVAAGFADEIDVTALRVAGVYGPRDTDLLPLFRMARRGVVLLPSGRGRVQPVFATDVAELVAGCLSRSIGFGPWPVAEPRSYAWSELAGFLGAALGRRVRGLHAPAAVFLGAAGVSEAVARVQRRAAVLDRRRALDLARHSYTCDVTDTERASGWCAQVGLADGLARTARWYQSHGWL